MRKTILFVVVLLAASAVQAVSHGGTGAGYSAPGGAAGGPAAIARNGLDRLMAYLQKDNGDLKSLGAFLNAEVAPYFDFAYMAKAAAGNLYRYMSDEQRRQLADRIKRQFLASMVQRLGGYNKQQVKVMSERLSADGRTGVVTAAIRGPRGYPSRLDFRFYKSENGWKVYDVMANGQSAVVHYRRQFRRSVYRPPARGGGEVMTRPAYPQATSR